MFQRLVAIMLTGMLLAMTVGSHQANAQSGQDDTRVTKVRTDVFKLGVGEKARVEVKLRDNSRVKGYIGEATADSFVVVDSENGYRQTIAYADVDKVKKAGSGISTKSWIILGAAAVGAVATWAIVKPAVCDGGAQTRGPC
ncbi:MAG: hypothetical protein ACREBC_33650 [Pyrinomonadaceae bacterium]